MKRPAHVLHIKSVARQRKEKKFFVWKNLVQFFVIVPILFGIAAYILPASQVEAASGINKQINFQGKLVDNNGLNVADSSYTVVFSLYTVSSGGVAIWTETDSVSTANGVFQIALGAGTPFPGNVDFNSDTWYLGIKVGSDAEMTPRVRFSAVPYAFNAAALDGIVATNSATQFTITGGTNALIDLTVNGSLTLGSTIKPTAAGGLTIQSNGSNGLTLDTGGAATLAIGATANSITFGATNNPTYAFNGTGAVTFQGTSFTLGNGSAATIQTTANAGLTLLSSGSGNIALGQNTGNGGIVIQPNAGGNAALIINKQGVVGNPDLFAASASGVLKFSVDAGGNATAAASLNVGQPTLGFANAVGNFAGSSNNYLQVQVQNKSNGNAASTDFIATADNGTDTTNYIDVGINGSGYNQSAYTIGGANDGYLYTSNGALTIGTASNKPLIFHTNGTTSTNEAMRIDALGKVGIGTVGTNGPGNGQLVINQTNSSGLGDIFSASAAGTTKFTISNTGAITDSNYAGANAVMFAAPTTGLVTTAITTTGSQCLLSGSGLSGTPAWGGCGGASASLQTAYNNGQTIDLSQAGSGLIFGTNAGNQNVVIAPNAGGQAALIVNKQGTTGDIFTASASGSTKLVLSHAGNLGVGSSNPQEELTLGPTANLVGEMAVPTGATATLTTSGSLTNGSYYYKVTASDGVGETISSTETSVCQSASNQHTCNLSWSSVVGAVSYKIYRTSTSGSYTGTNFLVSVTTTSYSDTGGVTLTSGTPPSVTTAYVTKFTYSGNSWLIGDNFGIGTTNPLASLHIKGGKSGGNAAAIFDQVGASTNDILAASASGTTKFIVHNDGSIQTIGGNATADITSITAGNGLIILPKANGAGAGGGLTLKGGNGSTTAGGLVLDSGTGTSGSITLGSANATSITFGGSQNPTYAFNGSGTVTFQGTSFTLGNGSTATLQTSSNGGLTFLSAGTGNITLGQNAGVGGVIVQPNAGGQAALTINDQGSGDLLTASSSGTTQFLITHSGTAVLGASVTSANALTQSSLTIYDNGLGNSVLDINQLGLGDIFTASVSGATKFRVANNGSTTITSNSSSGLTVGANGATNPVLQIDASTGSVATGLRVLGAATGGTTALTVIDSGTNANLSIDAKGSGTITVGGTSTGSIIIGGASNGLTFSTTSGPSYAGTGRPIKQMVLSAEYPGAVLTASASAAISGNMTSDASPSAITNVAGSIPAAFSYENYYQWTATSLGSDQRYTVAVRVTLSKDFSSWVTGTSPYALTIDFNTPFTNSALDSLDVYIYQYGDTSSKPIAFRTAQASATSKNWTQVTIPSTDLIGGTVTWDSTHPSAIILLTMHSTNTVNYVQVGDITLNYLAAF